MPVSTVSGRMWSRVRRNVCAPPLIGAGAVSSLVRTSTVEESAKCIRQVARTRQAARSTAVRRAGPMALAAVVVALATLLLGTARAPSAAAGRDVGLRAHRAPRAGRPAREQHVRALALPPGAGQRPGVLAGARPLPRVARRRRAATSSPPTSPTSSATATSSTTRSPAAGSSRRSRSSTASRLRSRERMKFALAVLEKEPDFTLDESFEFDRRKAPWAQRPRGARRAVAQARQERRDLADARRQDLARGARRAAQALRARRQAQRADHRRRRVRESS